VSSLRRPQRTGSGRRVPLKEATKPVQRRDRIGVAIRVIDKMVRHLVNVAHPVPESSRCLSHIRTSAHPHLPLAHTVSLPRARQPDRSRASVYRGSDGRARLDYLPDLW
jgi:hypothetical protein